MPQTAPTPDAALKFSPVFLWLLGLAWVVWVLFSAAVAYPPSFSAVARFFSLPKFSFHFAYWLGFFQNISWIALAWIAAWGGGTGLWRWAMRRPASGFENHLLAAGLGWMACQAFLIFGAVFGIFSVWMFYVWLALGCALALMMNLRSLASGYWSTAIRKQARESPLVLALLALTLGLGMLLAHTPEIFFDSLVYHLTVPAAWNFHQRWDALPYHYISYLPKGQEIFYTQMLQLGDERLCRLLHWTFGAACVPVTWTLARQWLSGREAWWAAFALLTVPLFWLNMTTSGNDCGAALFMTLAVVSWVRAKESGAFYPYGALTGLLMGMALGIKMTALFLLAPLLLATVASQWQLGGWRRFRHAAGMGLLALIWVSPWLIKNALATGNPFFPFLYNWLPTAHLVPAKMAIQMQEFKEFGSRFFWDWIKLPWSITFYQATTNSFVGPFFLLSAPFALWVAGKRPGVFRALASALALGLIFWASRTQIARYLSPLFPALAVWGLVGLAHVYEKHALMRRLGHGLLAALGFWMILSSVSLIQAAWDPWPAALGLESKEAYLQRMLMNGAVEASAQVRSLPMGSKVLLYGESRGYYYGPQAIAPTVFDEQPIFSWCLEALDPEAVWQKIKQAGFTHVLVHQPEAARTRGYEPGLWTPRAVANFQGLVGSYLRPIWSTPEHILFALRQTPLSQAPLFSGKLLFMYTPEITAAAMRAFHAQIQQILQKNYLQAREGLLALAQQVPEWQQPRLYLGWVYQQVGQPRLALQEYQAAAQRMWLTRDAAQAALRLAEAFRDPRAQETFRGQLRAWEEESGPESEKPR